ncbi:methylated-DNA--[protein]-cysteine S-methyltransferase [Ideonella sp. A 288]|uniref:methylated-DNA--[protein]-cysteine S-methyltransferase n=1 Tax=Ideonella sp. A 288 TaxID=1962181 RepID=UPI000B4B3AD7|nr:methylated-DNA--[protein]-cysteine S-methyltransferase [Ideonella sp. A 288]
MTHPRLVAQARLETPLGPMTAAASAEGLAGLWFDGQAHHPGPLVVPTQPGHRWLKAADLALARYFSGDADPLRDLPLDLHGTPFQRAVWRALRALPRGHASTYAAIAGQAGSPAAVRAAGAAIGRNPVSVLVPCHRVLGASGALTGYAGGLDRKRALLRLEDVALPGAAAPRQSEGSP